jgi:maltokinase
MTGDSPLAPALARWLPTRRWFADKGRRIDRVTVHRLRELPVAGALGVLAIATVAFRDGSDRRYQVPLGLRRDRCRRPGEELIRVLDGVAVYDATADPALMTALLRELADGHIGTTYGPRLRTARVDPPARRVTGEQSNTSVVFGDEFVLKLFRTPAVGVNPELEVQRALRGNPHLAELVAGIEAETSAGPVTLGVVQEFQPHATDGWRMVTAAFAGPANRDATLDARLHALGTAVARVHASLASAFGTQPAAADAIRDGMVDRLAAAAREVPEIAAHQDALRVVFDAVRQKTGAVQRVHGDLHLGQVLWSAGRWLLIDFEGEPASPIELRRALQSPLRDVAGMLRSIDYAAAEVGPVAPSRLAAARAAFLAGYQDVSGDDPETPVTRAHELDKAIYEVRYEMRNRPDRVGIPLAAVRAFAAGHGRER